MKSIKGFSAVVCIVLFLAVNLYGDFLAAEQRDSVTYAGVTYYLPNERSQIQLPANLPESVIVKNGDTLWGLSGEYLKDSFLWPLIWESNMDTITNPHLIYPDQVIRFPKSGALVPTQAAEAPAGSTGTTTGTGGEQVTQRLDGDMTVSEYIESFRIPLGSQSDLERAGYITNSQEELGSIVATESPTIVISTDEIVYINLGENDNIKPGDVFSVFSYCRKVIHPHTKKIIGQLIQVKGRAKVICTQENSSTAMITKAFDAMYVGDKISPFVPAESKSREQTPETSFCKPSSGELLGYIVDVRSGAAWVSDGVAIGTEDIVYIDLGGNDGVAVGQYFATYKYRAGEKENYSFQRLSNGEILILDVKDSTATAIVTKALSEMSVGDVVDLIK